MLWIWIEVHCVTPFLLFLTEWQEVKEQHPQAVRHYHDKPQPTHEKSHSPNKANIRVNQPRRINWRAAALAQGHHLYYFGQFHIHSRPFVSSTRFCQGGLWNTIMMFIFDVQVCHRIAICSWTHLYLSSSWPTLLCARAAIQFQECLSPAISKCFIACSTSKVLYSYKFFTIPSCM